MKLPLLLAVSILAVLPAQADDKQELTRIETAFAEALAKNDPAAFRALITDDWKVVLGEGSVMTADQILNPLKEGKLKFSSFTVEDLDIRIYADAAVVIGTNHTKGEWDGQEFTGKSRFTDVFIRTDGKWRCVSSHSTDIANR
jgi:uncharacterized protein (TIGR02246 family)